MRSDEDEPANSMRAFYCCIGFTNNMKVIIVLWGIGWFSLESQLNFNPPLILYPQPLLRPLWCPNVRHAVLNLTFVNGTSTITPTISNI